MDLAEALAAEQLWGWPVGVLDQLLLLQQHAWAGAVSIEDWRKADTFLRSEQPPVDPAEVGAALAAWASSGELSLLEHGGLVGRVTVLANPAPTDEDLWVQLESALERAARNQNERFADVDNEKRDRIAGWLTRPGGGIDEVTGLPWSLVGEHREVDSVPQSVRAARQAALAAASESERARADLLASRRADLDADVEEWPS